METNETTGIVQMQEAAIETNETTKDISYIEAEAKKAYEIRDKERAERKRLEAELSELKKKSMTEDELKKAEAEQRAKEYEAAKLKAEQHDKLIADLTKMNNAIEDPFIKENIEMLRDSGVSESVIFQQATLLKNKFMNKSIPAPKVGVGSQKTITSYTEANPILKALGYGN